MDEHGRGGACRDLDPHEAPVRKPAGRRRVEGRAIRCLGGLAILPYIFELLSNNVSGLGFLAPLGRNSSLISGAGLLIVVGVVLDTMRQLEAQLMMRRYEGFIK